MLAYADAQLPVDLLRALPLDAVGVSPVDFLAAAPSAELFFSAAFSELKKYVPSEKNAGSQRSNFLIG